MHRRDLLRAMGGLGLPAASGLAGCTSESGRIRSKDGRLRLVVKYQPLGGTPQFRELLRAFELAHPGVQVVAEALPGSADLAHQFFFTALEGGSRDFDLFIVDIIWVPEFARAGWLVDLSSRYPPDAVRREFLPAAAEAVIVEGKTYAVPWYVDVGVLYRRRDLARDAPVTYDELTNLASVRHGETRGYLWQGRQYEGLVCNVYEAIWGFGGETLRAGRLLLDTDEARGALTYLRALVEHGVSAGSVTSAREEESRRAFQDGRASFMRNWPYAWADAQRPDSKIRGLVAISPLPTRDGQVGHGALGGFQLALSAHSHPDKREAALALLDHLTSSEASLTLALAYGRSPARRQLYNDPRLREGAPLLASLGPAVENARPRPVTPYYMMISDTLQGEFSAAVTGIRSPAEALRRAQAVVDEITESSL